MASRFAKQRGINSEKVVNLGVYCALVGMLGAKIADDRARSRSTARIRQKFFRCATLQSAGIFFGGFILALVFAFFYMRAQNLPVLATSDLFAPGLAIGHGIGRLGCFAAGCCWGKPTHLPWAVTFTNKNATTGVPLGIPLHPTQLYEALAEGIICLVLICAAAAPPRWPDDRACICCFTGGAIRGRIPARARRVESAGRTLHAGTVDLACRRGGRRVASFEANRACPRSRNVISQRPIHHR